MKIIYLIILAVFLTTAAFAAFNGEAQFGIGNTNTVAWGDYDGDGDLDLAVGNTTQNYLYRNNGNGTFTGLARFGNTDTQAMAWADYDNDGDLDIAVANSFSACYVYENTGGGSFTAHAGSFPNSDPVNSVSWGDYDVDGDVDLAFGCSISTPNMIFTNNSTIGNFDFTLLSYFAIGDTYGVYWGDFNDDNYPDIVCANIGQNEYYENYGDETFTGTDEFGNNADLTHSAALGDYDNAYYETKDNEYSLDVAIGGFGHRSKLFACDADSGFSEVAGNPFGNYTDNVVSINWGDYDNDGWLDLAAGSNESGVYNMLFTNNGVGNAFTSTEEFGNYSTGAVAWGDYDGDGDLDLAVGNDGVNYLYVNDENSTHYLIVRPVGDDTMETNVSGIGAKVWVYEAGFVEDPGYFVGYREVQSNCSEGQNPLDVHFAQPGVDFFDVVIDWPADDDKFYASEYWANIGSGQTIYLIEGTGAPLGIEDDDGDLPNNPTGFFLAPAVPNPSSDSASISFSLPYSCETTLELFDIKGRKIATLAEGEHQRGEYSVTVKGLSNGLYLYRLIADEYSDVKKMVVR